MHTETARQLLLAGTRVWFLERARLAKACLTSADRHGDLVAGNGAVKTFRQAELIAYCWRIVFCGSTIFHLQCGMSFEQHSVASNESAGILINTMFFFIFSSLFSLADEVDKKLLKLLFIRKFRVSCLFRRTTFISRYLLVWNGQCTTKLRVLCQARQFLAKSPDWKRRLPLISACFQPSEPSFQSAIRRPNTIASTRLPEL